MDCDVLQVCQRLLKQTMSGAIVQKEEDMSARGEGNMSIKLLEPSGEKC